MRSAAPQKNTERTEWDLSCEMAIIITGNGYSIGIIA